MMEEGGPEAEGGVRHDVVVAHGHESKLQEVDAQPHEANALEAAEGRVRTVLAPVHIVGEDQDEAPSAQPLQRRAVVGGGQQSAVLLQQVAAAHVHRHRLERTAGRLVITRGPSRGAAGAFQQLQVPKLHIALQVVRQGHSPPQPPSVPHVVLIVLPPAVQDHRRLRLSQGRGVPQRAERGHGFATRRSVNDGLGEVVEADVAGPLPQHHPIVHRLVQLVWGKTGDVRRGEKR
mmetsp:Transcript_44635/g.119050  ORF Transcript_44635/g.119050 Transcript_44635/m.119050 type:complete len:233 (-) Transcript_44635:184-882(-)